MSDNNTAVKELVEKIHQFLSHQVETSGELSEAAKESLVVASECIEQAYAIQRKPASSELLDIYRNRNSQSGGGGGGGPNQQAQPAAIPAQFIQNLASSILSSASASVSSGPTAPSDTSAQTQAAPTTSTQPPPAPRVRKSATEAEKMAAESFKNQGNDHMKQDKYKEAYDCYTQAINIDDNNAIYYSNRAAASSKLGDHQAALRDCQEAVLIDSNYSKAYGRMGLAYASLEDHQRAKEAYVKAVELDPHNESYRNNLKIAEEKLAGEAAGGAQNNMFSMLRSMMTNPEVMSMAMRSLQDPRMQNLFGLVGGQQAATGEQPAAATAGGGQQQQQPPSDQTSQSQETPQQPRTEAASGQQNPAQDGAATAGQTPGVNPADLFNLTSRLANTGNIDLVGAGQQLLSTIEQNNPDLINNMRRMMNQAFMPPNQNNSDRNPPPGYS